MCARGWENKKPFFTGIERGKNNGCEGGEKTAGALGSVGRVGAKNSAKQTAFFLSYKVLNPKSFLTSVYREHLAQLQLHFKNQEFTGKQARKALQQSKTNTNRVLSFFVSRELVKIDRIGIRGMFYYKLK